MAQGCTRFQRPAHCFHLLLWAFLFLSACSGLGGEPRIVATVPPAPPRVEDGGLPSDSPDLAQGARLYAENCTRCHGTGGQGDGPLTLSGQLPDPPPDFTDPATARVQSVNEWFDTITNGRLDKLMPPWRDELTEAERWSVALYTYTMSYDAEQLTQGQAVWEAHCAECHGETGAGDGTRAQELDIEPGDLSRPDALIATSDAAVFDLITQGKGDTMPAFADTLDDPERWAVTTYVRTLSLTNADFSGQPDSAPAATPEVEIASLSEVAGTISGAVTNASAGGQLPADLPLTLHILDTQGNEETRESTLNADGSFNFNDVPIRNDRGYLVTTTYQDRTFGSQLVQGDVASGRLELPFSLYELTDDRAVISIDSIIVQVERASERLEVTEIITYRNGSDRIYSRSEQISDGRYASVVIPLAAGAQVMDVSDDPERYVFAENLTAVIDTRPVLPGVDHVVHVSYSLPFQDGMMVDLPLEYALEGPVRLFAPASRLAVSSAQLPALDTQTMGGAAYETYGATLSLPAGDAIEFTVSDTGGAPAGLPIANNLLPYLFIAIGSISILIAAALYYFGRRMPAPAANHQQLTQVLLEQIAELDELHTHEQITTEAYTEQRSRLKARLAKLMKESESISNNNKSDKRHKTKQI